MMINYILLLVLFLMGREHVFSEIQQTKTVSEVASYMKELCCDDLAVFDVDMVLTHPENPAFQMPNLLRHVKIYKKAMEGSTPLEKDIAVSLMISRGPSSLVDKEFLTLLSHLRENRVKTLALSSVVTGALDGVPSMEAWRKKELNRLGVDFSYSFPEVKELIFNNFSPYRNHFAHYQDGVILSNGEHNPVAKGELLYAFLKRVGFNPKKIVFVDDRLENLTLAEAFFRENGPDIEYVGVHYVGAISTSSPEVDEAAFKSEIEKLNESWMDYRTIEMPSKTFVGISCRTSNKNPVEIGKLWERFNREKIFDLIPHKAHADVIALYCDYESDFTAPYTLILGCEVKEASSIPEGFVVKTTPASTYVVMPTKGEFVSIFEAWQSIWRSNLNRTYTGDFEVYKPPSSGQIPDVEILIAIKKE
jgi:predicted transcriptional regulator YdeE